MRRTPHLATLALLAPPASAQDEAERAEVETSEERRAQDHGFRHLLDIMELVDAPVFTRNTLQLKYEWTEKAAGAAMGEFTFKPVFVWGVEREFSLRLEIPVETHYPNAAGEPTVSGFSSVTSTFLWAFYSHEGIRQAAGLELQWNTATNAAVGQAWLIEPVYVVAFRLSSIVAISVELDWQKSFGYLGTYPAVNTLQLEPTVTVALPAECETALDPVAARGEVFMVGVLLSYFFEW